MTKQSESDQSGVLSSLDLEGLNELVSESLNLDLADNENRDAALLIALGQRLNMVCQFQQILERLADSVETLKMELRSEIQFDAIARRQFSDYVHQIVSGFREAVHDLDETGQSWSDFTSIASSVYGKLGSLTSQVLEHLTERSVDSATTPGMAEMLESLDEKRNEFAECVEQLVALRRSLVEDLLQTVSRMNA